MEERNWDGSSSHATNVQSQLEKQQCNTDDIQTVSRTEIFSTFRQASTVAPHLGIRLTLCGDPNASYPEMHDWEITLLWYMRPLHE